MADILAMPDDEFLRYFRQRGLNEEEAKFSLGAQLIRTKDLLDHVPPHIAGPWQHFGCPPKQ